MSEKAIFRHESSVTPAMRQALLNQKGCVVWFTGLSGSGKSTTAVALESHLIRNGHLAFNLDGDNFRHGLCSDLGFSPADRTENIRRLGEVARLFADAGVICLTSFISPQRATRELARKTIGPERFLEIHVSTDLAVCEQRDVKGLYRKARAGTLPEFTGISAPYEPPEHPDLSLDTASLPVSACVTQLIALLETKGLIQPLRNQ